MKNTIYCILAGFCLFFTSCEEVIELDLNTTDPQIVIEGFITDGEGPYSVLISKTVDFYDPNTFPPQTDAVVHITDDQGHVESLTETSPGIYETSTLQGKRGVSYTLAVQTEGQEYTATSRIPEQRIFIDSITTGYKSQSIFQDAGYYATAYFNDPPDTADYYRLQVLVNGEVYVFDTDDDEDEDGNSGTQDSNFWLLRDKFTNGNVQDYEFPHRLEPGDTFEVRLQHIDRQTYDYYRTLVDVISGNTLAPSNPITNWNNGALGYFGAFSETQRTAVVPE